MVLLTRGLKKMKKSQIVKCVKTKESYLTVGKQYSVIAGNGDVGLFGFRIKDEDSFCILDDDDEVIFQGDLYGAHGLFEVVS